MRAARSSQHVIILIVGLVVLLRIGTYALSAYFLLQDDDAMYRAVQVVGTAFAAMLDMILLVLVWMLFQAVERAEREAERLQAFMDNVYRKLLR